MSIDVYGPTEMVKLKGSASPCGILKEMLDQPRDKAFKDVRQWNAELNKAHCRELLESGAITKDQHNALMKALKKQMKQDYRFKRDR